MSTLAIIALVAAFLIAGCGLVSWALGRAAAEGDEQLRREGRL